MKTNTLVVTYGPDNKEMTQHTTMETAVIYIIILGVISGLSEGAGVLPEDLIKVAVGDTVTFTTTLTPPEQPFQVVIWTVGVKNIIASTTSSNTIDPGYKDRITLFRSTGSLELRNVSFNDSGEYRLNIISATGSIVNGLTRLDVLEPVSNVTVTVSNTDLVEFNSSVRLSCSSSGSPSSFLWLNSSSEVTASDRVQFTDGGSTLTIVSVTRYDQGPFRCRVFNLVSDDTSREEYLTISYGPDNVKVWPSDEYYAEGSNISLICSAESRPSALYHWFLNGDLLNDTGPELKLMNIQMSQSGNYSCQTFNEKTMRYATSQPSVVSVLEKITGASIRSSTNQPVEGNVVNLTCEAAGSVFTRKWMKNGSDLILTDNMILYNMDTVLSFQPLSKTDSGEYSCIISNPVSSDEDKYHMCVIYGPDNVKITGPSQIYLGKTLELTCSAESTPSASFTWKLNEKEIPNSSSVIIKDAAESSDSGNYTCQAVNKITGRTSSAVHGLSVTDKSAASCSSGCIAGIVIACCVVAGASGGGYYMYKKKINRNQQPHVTELQVDHLYEDFNKTSAIYENTK